MMDSVAVSRRAFVAGAGAALAAMACINRDATAAATTTQSAPRYRISASDWMMLKRQKPGAVPLAAECGLDGVEVDMGPLGKRPDFENNLRKEDFLSEYMSAVRQHKLEISSLAMSAFYGQPFADHPSAERFAREWIELMPKLRTRVGFLPIISKNDLASDEAARAKLIECFKKVGPVAQKAGVVLGLNTPLDADQNNRLLDAIGSSAVRIAYNIGEAVDAKRDAYKELKTLGRERIAQIIPTLSDNKWLQEDERIDVPKLKAVLDEMNWSGWLVLQRSRRAGPKPKENFSANAAYLKSIFQV
jgi:sugar phosphate isomerase/epimerase